MVSDLKIEVKEGVATLSFFDENNANLGGCAMSLDSLQRAIQEYAKGGVTYTFDK